MLDRTIAPPAGEIYYSAFPQVESKILSNGLPLHFLVAGEQPVLKLELTFDSGSKYEDQRCTSWLASKMLLEGTSSKSANQIAEAFDALGAHIEITPGFDQVTIGIFCLKKNFEQVLLLLHEILNDSSFPQKEFDLLKSNRSDQIRINDEKSNLYASKKIREALFGPNHFYGLGLTSEQVSSVELGVAQGYFRKQLFSNPTIFLSGMISAMEIELLERYLTFSKATIVEVPEESVNSSREIIVERPDGLQSSIRIGWKIPRKDHDEYFDYQIANCVLGGYFGSRLMKNIREEKGYTYGISTYPVHLEEASFGILGADVVADKTSDALTEIWKEIDKLRSTQIDDQELSAVTNYMAGSFMNSINTPFHLMEKFKGIYKFGLDYGFYERFFERLKSIKSVNIQEAVDKTFSRDNSSLVVVGRLN